MCRRVTCRQCKKPTWAGCGAHVETVLAGVPRADRCQCRNGGSANPRKGPTQFPTRAAATTTDESASPIQRFRRWLGK